MSQRDLAAELRAARIPAPAEVRERVRAIAATDTTARPPRFTWRRALIVALPVAAAVAATIVVTRPAHRGTALEGGPAVIQRATLRAADAKSAAGSTGPTAQAGPLPNGSTTIPVTPSRTRVQRYSATLALRV